VYFKGAKIWPTDIQKVLLNYPEVVEYQIIIDRPQGEFIINIEFKEGLDQKDKEMLLEKIREDLARTLIFVTPKLIPVYPNTLPRYEGKSKRVIVKEL
jgi:phenylacetate-CoA ligase